MLLASAVVFLLLGYFFGFYVRTLWDELNILRHKVKRQPKAKDIAPKSMILEPPLTPAERVQREQEELLERLNQPS